MVVKEGAAPACTHKGAAVSSSISRRRNASATIDTKARTVPKGRRPRNLLSCRGRTRSDTAQGAIASMQSFGRGSSHPERLLRRREREPAAATEQPWTHPGCRPRHLAPPPRTRSIQACPLFSSSLRRAICRCMLYTHTHTHTYRVCVRAHALQAYSRMPVVPCRHCPALGLQACCSQQTPSNPQLQAPRDRRPRSRRRGHAAAARASHGARTHPRLYQLLPHLGFLRAARWAHKRLHSRRAFLS